MVFPALSRVLPRSGTLQVHGRGSVNELAATLTEIPGVRAVIADDVNAVT